jgi:hypothetical protein
MRKRLILTLLCASPLFASNLYWYNGSPDLQDSLANEVSGGFGNWLIYSEFNVGPGGTAITGVFSNDTFSGSPDVGDAYWEIRSGVSNGNGGTLLASGTGAPTVTDTGDAYDGEIYTVEVDGLNVDLSQGTYWLAVAPDFSSGENSWLVGTDGANAVGSPAGTGDSYLTDSLFGDNFVPTADYNVIDYSVGVVTSVVTPEPATAPLVAGAGLIFGLTSFARIRRKRRGAL